GCLLSLGKSPGRSAAEPPAGEKQTQLPPASRYQVRVAASSAEAKTLLAGSDAAWEPAAPTKVLLSRTPRLYQTEPGTQPPIPGLEVRAMANGDKLFLRLRWDDATKDAPVAPPRKTGEGGDPERLYKRPTAETAAFSDAAAVMVPIDWKGPGFPSLQMGS